VFPGNTQLLTGLYAGGSDRLRYTFTGQRARATNNYPYLDPATGTEVNRSNSGYSGWDFGGKVVADLGARRRLTFSTEYGDADKELPGSISYATPHARQGDRRALIDLAYQMPAGDQGDLSVRFYRTQLRNSYADPDAFVPANEVHRATSDTAELLGHARPIAGNDLTYGYEFRSERLNSTSVGRHSRSIHAVYAQDQMGIGRLQVIPGARMVCVVTMKLRPVRIDENPRMNAPRRMGATFVTVVVEYGV
jgi:hypothetical protein